MLEMTGDPLLLLLLLSVDGCSNCGLRAIAGIIERRGHAGSPASQHLDGGTEKGREVNVELIGEGGGVVSRGRIAIIGRRRMEG